MKAFAALVPLFLFSAMHASLLEAVESGDMALLIRNGGLVANSLSSSTCRAVEFKDAVLRAAELGQVDSIKYLSRHSCSLVMNSFFWDQAMDLANENGHTRLSNLMPKTVIHMLVLNFSNID